MDMGYNTFSHNKMNNNKILIIANVFPPSGGPGVQRTSKFVKYLPIHNWEPIVLTGQQKLRIRDDKLLSDIPLNTKIVKTFNMAPSESLKQTRIRGYFYRVLAWLSIPDLGIWWLPFSFLAGIKIFRQHQLKLIYATGGPFSSFILGVILKRIFKLPLILDFRDPWTLNPRRLPRKWHVLWREPIEGWLERVCLKNADKVLCVSEPMVQLFATRYGKAIIQKFAVITNGFDPDDFVKVDHNKFVDHIDDTDKITVNYVGTISSNRTFNIFLKGIQILLCRRPEFKTKLRCSVIGNNLMISKPELDSTVCWFGYVNHSQAINLMCQADFLLLLAENAHEATGKIFEYIATGNPILALAPAEGAIAQVLDQANLGKVVSPTDANAVANGLEELLDDLLAGIKPQPNWPAIEQYSRKKTTGQLAAIFDSLANT